MRHLLLSFLSCLSHLITTAGFCHLNLKVGLIECTHHLTHAMAVMRGPIEQLCVFFMIKTIHHGGKIRHAMVISTADRDILSDHLLKIVSRLKRFGQIVENERLIEDQTC
jgi:hypothetical protein